MAPLVGIFNIRQSASPSHHFLENSNPKHLATPDLKFDQAIETVRAILPKDYRVSIKFPPLLAGYICLSAMWITES